MSAEKVERRGRRAPPTPMWLTTGKNATLDSTTKKHTRAASHSASLPSSVSPPPPPLPRSPRTAPASPLTIETDKVDVSRVDDRKCVNQYLLEDTIGRGSFGKVKKAVNTQNGQVYAIKVMDKAKMKRKRHFSAGKITDQYQGIRREIAIMKKLSHPHIIQLHEVIDDPENEKIYLVLDFAEKGALMNGSPTAEPVPLDQCRSYFRDMISGLEYLHFQKVAHRDLKPENLLLTSDGRVKIADFGVSLLYEGGDDMVRTTAGSAAFMAPEMCVAESGSFSASVTDIWSAGVTLFFLVFGKCPFFAPTTHEIFDQIATMPVVFPNDIPDDLQDLLSRMLDKNPATRITVPEIKRHDWVTQHGQYPMPDLVEDVVSVSAEEVSNAFTFVQKVVMVVRLKGVMNRWKTRISMDHDVEHSSVKMMQS